jgi:hypothetical protein
MVAAAAAAAALRLACTVPAVAEMEPARGAGAGRRRVSELGLPGFKLKFIVGITVTRSCGSP